MNQTRRRQGDKETIGVMRNTDKYWNMLNQDVTKIMITRERSDDLKKKKVKKGQAQVLGSAT